MVTVYVVNYVIGTKNSDAFIEVMQLWKVQLWRFDWLKKNSFRTAQGSLFFKSNGSSISSFRIT